MPDHADLDCHASRAVKAAHLLCLLAGAALLSACATQGGGRGTYPEATLAPDPFEPFNRVMLDVNTGLEKVVIRPLSSVYRYVTPAPARRGLANAAANALSPVSFANALLQGRPGRAGKTLLRFLINSTIGLGGLFDVAADNGMPPQREDFGQTLAVWGIGHGPFLVLPLIGPTSLRDGIGFGVDTITDPLFWLLDGPVENYSYYGASLLVAYDGGRDELDSLRQSSIDFYAALRSAYLQHRLAESFDGAPPPNQSPPDILDGWDRPNAPEAGAQRSPVSRPAPVLLAVPPHR